MRNNAKPDHCLGSAGVRYDCPVILTGEKTPMADEDTKTGSEQDDTQEDDPPATTDHSPEAAQVGTSDGDGDSG